MVKEDQANIFLKTLAELCCVPKYTIKFYLDWDVSDYPRIDVECQYYTEPLTYDHERDEIKSAWVKYQIILPEECMDYLDPLQGKRMEAWRRMVTVDKW